jgi:hypothetical protein
MARRKKPGTSVGQVVGGAMVGFDHQIFRSTPPPHELVKKGTRMPAVPAEDGGTLSIEMPEDEPQADAPDRAD